MTMISSSVLQTMADCDALVAQASRYGYEAKQLALTAPKVSDWGKTSETQQQNQQTTNTSTAAPAKTSVVKTLGSLALKAGMEWFKKKMEAATTAKAEEEKKKAEAKEKAEQETKDAAAKAEQEKKDAAAKEAAERNAYIAAGINPDTKQPFNKA